ncbi:MAG: hypothetical protein U0441_02430 [Polyangiaceae bacterium]
MSLILAAIAIGALCASASGGYLVASRRRPLDPGDRDDSNDRDDRNKPPADARRDAPGASSAARDASVKKSGERTPTPAKIQVKRAFEATPLALGDVVLAEGEERWLAGAIVAREGDKVVAAVFFAPEGAVTKVVAAFARPRRDVAWLSPARVDSPNEPPASIEIDGAPMTRRGRLPVTLATHGQGVPRIGDTGILAEYEGGADDVALLLTTNGQALAWRGRKLEEGAYDRLGNGGED